MKTVRWIAVLAICFSIVSCAKVIRDVTTTEERDMDWYYEHNGYAVMTVVDLQNEPVMDIFGIPLNSEAMWKLVHDEVADAEVHAQLRIKRQYPVIYLTAHAYRECLFFWPSFVLEQGQARVYPAKVFPAQSKYLAAVGRLYKRYGVERVDTVHRRLGLFRNPYTGRDLLELDKEIELAEGASIAAIVNFGGGLRLNEPFRLVYRGGRHVLLSGESYTTRNASKPIKIYAPLGQDVPGKNIYKYGYIKMSGRTRRKRIE